VGGFLYICTMKVDSYLRLMGVSWEFVIKPKHILMRYNYRNNKSYFTCDKPYKLISDPINEIYDNKEFYNIEQINDVLMFILFCKLNDKFNLHKIFPKKIESFSSKFLKKCHYMFLYQTRSFIFTQFKSDHNLSNYEYVPNEKYRDRFEIWIKQNCIDFISMEDFDKFFV